MGHPHTHTYVKTSSFSNKKGVGPDRPKPPTLIKIICRRRRRRRRRDHLKWYREGLPGLASFFFSGGPAAAGSAGSASVSSRRPGFSRSVGWVVGCFWEKNRDERVNVWKRKKCPPVRRHARTEGARDVVEVRLEDGPLVEAQRRLQRRGALLLHLLLPRRRELHHLQ